MGLTFVEAQMIALKHIPSDCVLIEDSSTDTVHAWYFQYQNKEYLATGNDDLMFIGSGGFAVNKNTGSIYEFDSGQTIHELLQHYDSIFETGFICGTCNLTILEVLDISEAIKLLYPLKLSYMILEYEHGREWRIKRNYSKKQIAIVLTKLPVTFVDQNVVQNVKLFQAIQQSDALKYNVIEYHSNQNTLNP